MDFENSRILTSNYTLNCQKYEEKNKIKKINPIIGIL